MSFLSSQDNTPGHVLNKSHHDHLIQRETTNISGIDDDKSIPYLPKDSLAPKKVPLMPMSPLAASATVINLILATGPFR
jgi:hypothetical protein